MNIISSFYRRKLSVSFAILIIAVCAVSLYQASSFKFLWINLGASRFSPLAPIIFLVVFGVALILPKDFYSPTALNTNITKPTWLSLVLFSAGLVPYYMLINLFEGDQRLAILLWFTVLALVALCVLFFYRAEWQSLVKSDLRNREVICLILLFMASTWFMASAFGHSDYFLWPDENEFVLTARKILNGNKADILWGFGGFNEHPALASLYTAIFMRICGDTIFGFRIGTVIACTVSIFPLFIAGRCWCRPGAAWFCIVSYLFSFFLQSFGKIGYNNALIIPVFSFTLCFASLALRRRSIGSLWLGGGCAALGLYVNYFSIVFIPFMLLVPLIAWYFDDLPKNEVAHRLLIIICAYLLVGLPILMHFDSHFYTALDRHTSLSPYSIEELKTAGLSSTAPLLFKGWNIKNSTNLGDALVAPLGLSGFSHFTNANFWFDGLTGVLYALGVVRILMGLAGSKKHHSLLLMGWLIVGLGLALTTKYNRLPPTRAVVLPPLVSLLAAIGLNFLLKSFNGKTELRLALIAATLIFFLNLHALHSYRSSAASYWTHYWPMVQRALEEEQKVLMISREDLSRTLIFYDSLYGWSPKVHHLSTAHLTKSVLDQALTEIEPGLLLVRRDLVGMESKWDRQLSQFGYQRKSCPFGWIKYAR